MKLVRSILKRKLTVWFGLMAMIVLSFGCGNSDNSVSESPINVPRTENEFEGNAEQRNEWFMQQRMYPFDKIPDEARRKAWLNRPSDDQDNLLGSVLWQPIGPNPTTSAFPNNWGLTSGRINSVAVSPANPQLVLVGGATGGVWRSIDGGNTFAPTSDSQVDLAVGSIVFAPSNPTVVYAGMGDKAGGYLGSGLLKSTDSGVSWTRISNATLPSPGNISQVLVHPTNSNLVYVAQYAFQSGNTNFSSGFFTSSDGGVSWTKTLSGLPRDLVQHPTQAGTLYLAVDRFDGGAPSTGGIFRSVNSGASWTRVYTSPFASTSNIKIAVTPAAPLNLYVLVSDGTSPRVERSTNEGGNWTNLGAGSGFDGGQFSYNCYLFVHPTDTNTIYVGTRDLWRSTDAGVNYTNITNNFQLNGSYTPNLSRSHPDQHHFYQYPGNPSTMFLANDGGLWKTVDNATTFTSLNATLSLTMFTSLDLHPTNAAITYGGTQDNGTQRRTGNLTWHEFISGDGGQTIIDPLDPSIVFTTFINHTIYRFNSNGSIFGGTIGSSAAFASDRVAFYPPFVGNDSNSNLYFGTFRLYISTNRGLNWTAPGGTTDLTNGGRLSAIGVGKSNVNTIYTGSDDGRLMVSTDTGVNWTNRSAGLPNRFIKSIIVSPTNSNVAYVTVSGFGTGHVFKTTNAGANWTDISGNLPNIPANTLLISPSSPTTLLVGTDIGVFRSTTDGTTWATYNSGMPPTIITELDSQPNGLIQASSYGRGAYEFNPNAVNRAPFDFDGDNKTDAAIFRPGPGQWWYLRSSDTGNRAFSFGVSTDKIVPADYTGDGKADLGLFRPGSGEWFILRSEDSSFYAFPFGVGTDIPAPSDFDGDGKADPAVFRPSNVTWYIIRSSDMVTTIGQFGAPGDKPVPADYDGDRKADLAIFRPSNGQWWILRSQLGLVVSTFGVSTDRTVPGDYTGDGKADVAFFRPSSNEWFVLRSEDSSFFSGPFGASGDFPVPGDYDGDGKFDLAVFRPGNSTWYVQRSTAGSTAFGFGAAGDLPVPNAYVR